MKSNAPGVGGHSEYIKASLVGEALTPDVHEFSALFEFDSTFVTNTAIATIGVRRRTYLSRSQYSLYIAAR